MKNKGHISQGNTNVVGTRDMNGENIRRGFVNVKNRGKGLVLKKLPLQEKKNCLKIFEKYVFGEKICRIV
jgi:hypothetical protein